VRNLEARRLPPGEHSPNDAQTSHDRPPKGCHSARPELPRATKTGQDPHEYGRPQVERSTEAPRSGLCSSLHDRRMGRPHDETPDHAAEQERSGVVCLIVRRGGWRGSVGGARSYRTPTRSLKCRTRADCVISSRVIVRHPIGDLTQTLRMKSNARECDEFQHRQVAPKLIATRATVGPTAVLDIRDAATHERSTTACN
jgi:hypothetical protein